MNTSYRFPWFALMVVVGSFLLVSGSLMAQTPGPVSAPAPAPDQIPAPVAGMTPVDQAAISLWVDGPSEKNLEALKKLSAGPHDARWGKAMFHLACAHLLKGERAEAARRLQELEAEAGKPEIAGFVAPLKNLLNPVEPKKEPMSLDFQDVQMESVIRMIAKNRNRGVIVDGDIEPKKISLHLPVTNFEEVMKILSELGNFEMKMVGDILLITPNEKKVDAWADDSGKLNLDLKDVDVRDALRLVAVKGNVNLVFHKNVGGRLTIRLEKVAPFDALRMITRAADLFLEKDGDNYLVMNLAEREKLTGKSDMMTVPLRNLDAKDAVTLLRDLKLVDIEPNKEGNALFLKGAPELLEKARDLLMSQDKPQAPLQISVRIWEIVKAAGLKVEEFPKLSETQQKELATLLSSPRIITIPGRQATIEIKSSEAEAGKKALQLKLSILPVSLGDDMVRLEMRCEVKTLADGPNQKNEALREFASTFVVKMGSPFAYEVQGGSVPTLMEIMVTKSQQ